jgi:hypothetical protein
MAEPLRLHCSEPDDMSGPQAFLRIPKSVMSRRDVTDMEKIVLAALTHFDRGDGTNATDEDIGAVCGKLRSTVSIAVGRLVDRGFLIRTTTGRFRSLRLAFRFRSASDADPDSARDSRRDPQSEQGRESRRKRPGIQAQAPGSPGASAGDSGRLLNFETGKQSETTSGPIPALGGAGPGPRPGKMGSGPPGGYHHRRDEPPPHDNQLGPCGLAMMTAFEGGGGPSQMVGRLALSAHRGYLSWYKSRGFTPPPFEARAEDQAREWLVSMGVTLPIPDAGGEKTPAAGNVAKLPPPPAGQTIHD